MMEKKVSLLIVDDDESIVEVLDDLLGLEGEGHEVSIATSVREALKELSQKDFPLMTTDHMFPGGGGLHLVEITRVQHPSMKILSIAGEKQKYGNINLKKPVDVFDILEAVEKLLSS